jgi:hypothetical protein
MDGLASWHVGARVRCVANTFAYKDSMETECCSPYAQSQEQLGKELLKAVDKGQLARVQELIASGADVKTRNPDVSFMS